MSTAFPPDPFDDVEHSSARGQSLKEGQAAVEAEEAADDVVAEEVELLRERIGNLHRKVTLDAGTITRQEARIRELERRDDSDEPKRAEDLEARIVELGKVVTARDSLVQSLKDREKNAREELESIPPFLREAAALNLKKSRDYGTEGDLSKRAYHPFGVLSYLHMLHLKLNRLTSVLTQEGPANFESARDSVLDGINYASFLGAYLDEETGCGPPPPNEETLP